MADAQSTRTGSNTIIRTFRDLSDEEVADIEGTSAWFSNGWSDGIDWTNLLDSRRVLIISEAGAGKTYECRAQRDILWAAGEPAFYLDLAELARSNMRDMLFIEEEARLDAWLRSQSEDATFFLDSYDELKLSLGSFEQALKRLAKALSGQGGRARIVVTTRPIPIDQQLIRQHLPVPEQARSKATGDEFADIAMNERHTTRPSEPSSPIWRNVALMPLSNAQIIQMAQIEGVTDTDALMADILRRNAHDFARRPQDLIEICADWRNQHQIRTHREQVSANITVKLKPRADRPEKAQLSPDMAIEGASRIALAALLTRKFTLRHNIDADRNSALKTALDPAIILSEWAPAEREALLERPLFGFATYGRVRFHHRSVIEYLAAERLHTLLASGMPIKSVKRLLFTTTAQRKPVVRPSLRPVAGWLAALNGSIFRELLECEPNVLLDYGDPRSLQVHERAQALSAYVKLYGPGGWRGLQGPYLQAHRFAAPGLASGVLRLWSEGVENPEVREFLLTLIGAGPMPECAEIAYQHALQSSVSRDERIEAVEALAALGDHRLDEITASIESDPVLWPNDLTRALVVRLFPTHLTVEQLCVILDRVTEKRNTIGDIGWRLPQAIQSAKLSSGQWENLREGLHGLVANGVTWQRKAWPHVQTPKPFLIPTFAATCLHLLKAGSASPELFHSIVLALRVARDDDGRDEPAKLLRQALDQTSATTRAAVFWADDAFIEGLHPAADPWSRFLEVAHHGAIRLRLDPDASWVHAILQDRAQPLSKRTMMLRATMHGVWDGQGDKRSYVEGLKVVVADAPDLVAIIDEWLRPAEADPELERLEAKIAKRDKREKRRKVKARLSWVKFWEEIADHPDQVFSPDRSAHTVWNLWRAMERTGDDSRASGWNRRFIERHFGKDVADRLRLALAAVWRNDKPSLRSERKPNERNTYLVRWQLGLAAIAAEAEDATWAEQISAAEASLAARYVPLELNGFPSWLEGLIAVHPAAVDSVLGAELTAELEEPAVAGTYSMLLQHSDYATSGIVALFLPRLRAWLTTVNGTLGDNQDQTAAGERLRRVLEILLKHGGTETTEQIHIAAIAHFDEGAGELDRVWLPVLMRLDPAAGVDVLERLLDETPPESEAAVTWFDTLFGDRHNGFLVNLKAPSVTPSLLLRLVRLGYQKVPPSGDIQHEGSYSPSSRDYAQHGRDAVLSAILASEGSEGWKAKLEMANDPLFGYFRDRVLALAESASAAEADGIALDDQQVIALDKTGEAAPATPDAMFQLMRDRLDDFDDLLLQDVSPREAWAGISNERVMRREMARELRNRANNAYTVDQEAVTADENQTDVRMRSIIPPEQAVIELKIGDKDRSAADLRNAIRGQLVTKYMAEEAARSGCLMITLAADKGWRHPDTKKHLDFQGLIVMLQAEAAKIEAEMGSSLRLMVKGLDLRPRLPKEQVG